MRILFQKAIPPRSNRSSQRKKPGHTYSSISSVTDWLSRPLSRKGLEGETARAPLAPRSKHERSEVKMALRSRREQSSVNLWARTLRDFDCRRCSPHRATGQNSRITVIRHLTNRPPAYLSVPTARDLGCWRRSQYRAMRKNTGVAVILCRCTIKRQKQKSTAQFFFVPSVSRASGLPFT